MFIHANNIADWNAVDVRVDGQLQLGHVVNVVEKGLIIDFGCPGQRSTFVAFGTIFQGSGGKQYQSPIYWDYQSKTPFPEPAEGADAQVLLRATPRAPWVWYPGKVMGLYGFCCDATGDSMLAQVQLPHGVVTELMLEEQVRAIDQPARRQIVEKDFVVRCCPLPVGYWSEASAFVAGMFRFWLGHKHKVRCTAILSQTLLYLQCQTAAPLDAAAVEQSYAAAKKDAKKDAALHPISTPSVLSHAATRERKTPTPAAQLTVALGALPAMLHTEILQSLNTMDRMRCRRVSYLWNTLITTEAYFPDVCLSGLKADYNKNDLYPMFWVVAGVLKCVSSRTRVVVFRHMDRVECQRTLLIIKHLRGGVRLPMLVLDRCRFINDWVFSYPIGVIIKEMVEMFAAAERIVMKNCRMDDESLKAEGVQCAFDGQSDAEVEQQLWDLFEKNLALKKPLDIQWVTECIAKKRRKRIKKEVIKGLKNYQSVDPRESTHYRHREWTVDEVLQQLDVSKLSRVTAAALSESLAPDE
ncbi:uncharacterized protein LOC129596653 [Paramacrobiotus metropolitanus]|uniref:uncharacterized protein LOC129596653 n=1 Tax=Paramacrobiotus metropolitanus TaxID=2943436 RepID=UPI002445D320|nr:uncharacterized protein LOC129596653 [Paramacrobiotus metropolitanus]